MITFDELETRWQARLKEFDEDESPYWSKQAQVWGEQWVYSCAVEILRCSASIDNVRVQLESALEKARRYYHQKKYRTNTFYRWAGIVFALVQLVEDVTPWPDEERERAYALHAQGSDARDIRNRIGHTERTICYWLEERGFNPYPPKPAPPPPPTTCFECGSPFDRDKHCNYLGLGWCLACSGRPAFIAETGEDGSHLVHHPPMNPYQLKRDVFRWYEDCPKCSMGSIFVHRPNAFGGDYHRQCMDCANRYTGFLDEKEWRDIRYSPLGSLAVRLNRSAERLRECSRKRHLEAGHVILTLAGTYALFAAWTRDMALRPERGEATIQRVREGMQRTDRPLPPEVASASASLIRQMEDLLTLQRQGERIDPASSRVLVARNRYAPAGRRWQLVRYGDLRGRLVLVSDEETFPRRADALLKAQCALEAARDGCPEKN